MSVFEAFITNLGKYNEGELVGKWHEFPTTKEEIQKTFSEIGIDGVRYEELFITDYDCEIDGISDKLGEYTSVDELNYLASRLEDMSSHEIEVYEEAIELGDYSADIKDLINLTENLDCFDYLKGIESDHDLGYFLVEESGYYNNKNMGSLTSYIDYERLGRDVRLEEGGTLSGGGYVRNNGDTFYENFDGIDVPDEYKVFALPRAERASRTKLQGKHKHDRGAR